MIENRPEISVILTSYNYERFLPRAIYSALAQDAPGLEIVIVDNASTDESWQVIQGFTGDSRVRAYRNESNLGLIGNHNRGLELARGRRVLFLSADDYLLPGHIAHVQALHHTHPQIDVFYAPYFKVDENDRVTGYFGHAGHLRGSYWGGRNEFAELLTHDCYMCFPTTLFDRDQVINSGGLDPDVLAFDYELYIRLARAGKTFGFTNRPGACIRVHSSAASGEERYVASGKQLLEHLHVLERHLVSETYSLIAGRQHGIARLLNAKINNARSYADLASNVLPDVKPRIDAIASRLGESISATSQIKTAEQPRISVLMQVADLQAALDVLTMVQAQDYANLELVIVTDLPIDASPLLYDRAALGKTRIVTHGAPQRSAVAYNDALRIASGDIIVYCENGTIWPDGHLKRIAGHFNSSSIDVLVMPVDLVATRNGAPVATYERFSGSPIVQQSALIGEAVPLSSLAHRRSVVDRHGAFEERLTHCAEFEFASRLFSRSKVGLDDGLPVVLRKGVDEIHPALSDPQGYLAALKSVYASRNGDAGLRERMDLHVSRLEKAITRAAAAAEAGGIFRFWSEVRGAGGTQDPKSSAMSRRPRVLMIDDRVPYRELGRGYPRARDVLEALRDVADVKFYPLIYPFDEAPHTSGVSGVEVLYGRGTQLLASTLDQLLPQIDILWISRPHNMELVRKALGTLPAERSWKILYDAEAIYAHREIAKAAVEQRPLEIIEQRRLIERELRLFEGSDAIFAVSQGDRDDIAAHAACPVEVLSFSLPCTPSAKTFEERQGLLFVGAIEQESPNEDALLWFAANVLPLLQSQGIRSQVRHAGVMKSQALLPYAPERIQFMGMVPDLQSVYAEARVFIAPSRFAAGLPQKVYEAAAHGLPVVASSLLSRQLGWKHEKELLVADSPEQWVSAIQQLDKDPVLWNSLRERALAAVRREVAPEVFRTRISETITKLYSQTARNEVGAVRAR